MVLEFLKNSFVGLYYKVEDENSQQLSAPPNPKGFFANERTLLSWLKFSLVLGSLAVGLLNFTDSWYGIISASVFATVSCLLMVHSYYTFRWRAAKLSNKELGYYDDNLGPIALIVSVILAILINFWLHYIATAF